MTVKEFLRFLEANDNDPLHIMELNAIRFATEFFDRFNSGLFAPL